MLPKLALIVDKAKRESYEIHDDKSYLLGTNTPYSFQHSIGNECHIGFWSYPKLFGDGYFIKVDERPLPALELDVIILALESEKWKEYLAKVRKAYPNAKIVGTIKELSSYKYEFLESCDYIGLQYSNVANILGSGTRDRNNLFWLPQPVDIEFLRSRYITDSKEVKLFCYEHHASSRRGRTSEFCRYMAEKHHMQVTTATTTGDNQTQWASFIDTWKDCLFHVNLDPEYQFGQQATQCAALQTINIGGLNDSHFKLFPKTATNDFDILETELIRLATDASYTAETMQYAYDRVNKLYSIPAVAQTLLKNITG